MKDKIEQIVGKVESGHLEPKEAVEQLLFLCGVSQQRELLKVLEYTRQIKNNPKDIQLIVDKLYVENL